MPDIKHLFTEKLGPLPAWGWAGIGVVAYLVLFRKSSSPGTQALQSLPAGVGSQLASVLPNDTSGATSSGTSGSTSTGTTTTTTPPTTPTPPYTTPPPLTIPTPQPVGPSQVPFPFTPTANLPPAQQAQLPAGSAGVSPQELAYLNGGAAGETAFLNNQAAGLFPVSSNPNGYGGLSAASTPTYGIFNGNPLASLGPQQPAPVAQPQQTPFVPQLQQILNQNPQVQLNSGGGVVCPPGSRYLPGVGGPGLCVPFNTPIGAPV
jgi:hypothetical protein